MGTVWKQASCPVDSGYFVFLDTNKRECNVWPLKSSKALEIKGSKYHLSHLLPTLHVHSPRVSAKFHALHFCMELIVLFIW